MSKQKHYVVYWQERLRDSVEEGARLAPSLEDALVIINKYGTGFGADNTEFQLFELGKEIPIVQDKVQEPQPPKETVKYRLAKESK